MEESDFLFDLVKSLDEKEYKFVLEFVRGSKGKSIKRNQLLQDLYEQEEYDAQVLKSKYHSIHVLKFQIKQMLMQALRVYHEEESVVQRINAYLSNERILYKKGFYRKALRELDDAQRLAEDHQILGRLLDILKLKQSRLVEMQMRDLYSAVRKNLDYIDHILNAYNEETKAYCEYQEIFASYRTGGDVLELAPSTYSKIEIKPFNFFAEMYENAAQNLQALVRGDLRNAITSTEKTVESFERNPRIMDELQPKYKIMLANLGVLLIRGGRFEEVADIIRKLNALDSRDFNEEAETFQNTIHIELLLMLNQRNFLEQNDLIQRVEHGLERYSNKINAARMLSIRFNLLLLYILNENFWAAKSMMERILSNKKYQVRKELQSTTRLLEVMIHFELDPWDEGNIIISAKRYLERNDQLTDFKLIVLKYLHALTISPMVEWMEIFRQLENALLEIARDENNEGSLGLSIITAWARSRYQKKSLKECLDELYPKGSIDLGNV